jgi:streptomycin 6-kinase
MRVPGYLEWLWARPDGAEWLERLPALVAACADQWELTLSPPFEDGGQVSYVAPATTPDGTPVVLKVQWPHREAEHEAEALRRWGGDGAVRLLAHDPDCYALLLEQAQPGIRLAASPPELAVGVIIGLVQRLSVPVTEPFTTLADEATIWGDELPRKWEQAGRPFEPELVDRALGLLGELAPSQGASVLLHQDLHSDNVLAAEREPWLAIDPKPLAGEVEFAVAPLCRDYTLGHSRRAVRHRLDRFCAELGLDRERARGWAFAQTVAWAFDENKAIVRHVDTARWLAD